MSEYGTTTFRLKRWVVALARVGIWLIEHAPGLSYETRIRLAEDLGAFLVNPWALKITHERMLTVIDGGKS